MTPMNMKTDSFLAVLKALHEHGVEYILVGGLAVGFYDISRITKDLDIFVKREPQNIENLRRALTAVFQDDAIIEITFEELEKYPVLRYGTPLDYYIDIMDRIGEAFSYNDLEYEIIESQGIPVRVATIATLIKLKKDPLRERDQLDVAYLTEKLREQEK